MKGTKNVRGDVGLIEGIFLNAQLGNCTKKVGLPETPLLGQTIEWRIKVAR